MVPISQYFSGRDDACVSVFLGRDDTCISVYLLVEMTYVSQ